MSGYAMPAGGLSYDPRVLDAAGFVIADVPCRKCSYNLRGLNLAGRCPEYGTPVGRSVTGDLLRYSDPTWVRTLQSGIQLILWSIVAMIVSALVVALLVSVIGRVAVLIPLLAYVLTLLGTWKLTEPDPSGLGEAEYGTARKLIRVTLLLGVVYQLLSIAQQWIVVSKPVFIALSLVGLLFGIANVIQTFATLRYLGKLALRIPDLALAARANFLMYALAVTYGVLLVVGVVTALILGQNPLNAVQPGQTPPGGMMAVGCVAGLAGLAAVVFGIMYLVMISKLGKRFGEQADIARQSWATGVTSPGAMPPPAM